MDLISIIIPIHNAESYLERCLMTVCNQTHQNLDIILVDDGSTDDSLKICKKWADHDRRIQVVHQENNGVSSARNTGIEHSHGQYILMVDSDDYIALDAVQCLYELMQKTNSQIALCDYESGEDENYLFEGIAGTDREEQLSGEEALLKSYQTGHDALKYIAPWGKLYKKELFAQIRYPVGRIFEDMYVTHKLLVRAETIACTTRKAWYYYIHGDSIMHAKFHLGKLDYLDAMTERIQFYRERGLSQLEEYAYDDYLHALIWEYSRTRDILKDKTAMANIANRYKTAYRKGYKSRQHKEETALFLYVFSKCPEAICWFWRIKHLLGIG